MLGHAGEQGRKRARTRHTNSMAHAEAVGTKQTLAAQQLPQRNEIHALWRLLRRAQRVEPIDRWTAQRLVPLNQPIPNVNEFLQFVRTGHRHTGIRFRQLSFAFAGAGMRPCRLQWLLMAAARGRIAVRCTGRHLENLRAAAAERRPAQQASDEGQDENKTKHRVHPLEKQLVRKSRCVASGCKGEPSTPQIVSAMVNVSR